MPVLVLVLVLVPMPVRVLVLGGGGGSGGGGGRGGGGGNGGNGGGGGGGGGGSGRGRGGGGGDDDATFVGLGLESGDEQHRFSCHTAHPMQHGVEPVAVSRMVSGLGFQTQSWMRSMYPTDTDWLRRRRKSCQAEVLQAQLNCLQPQNPTDPQSRNPESSFQEIPCWPNGFNPQV